MSCTNDHLTSIRHSYPDLRVKSARSLDHGQNNDILILNDELIFRFPRYPNMLASLSKEIAVLRHIAGRTDLQVPNPEYANTEIAGPHKAFVGYRMIPGAPLWPESLARFGDKTLERVASQLTGFLSQLHDDGLSKVELPIADTNDELSNLYLRIREKLFPCVSQGTRDRIRSHFESHLSRGDFLDSKPALRHGDFGPSNILFDETTATVTGIIDFGNSGLGDPAYDFAGLLSGYGDSFLNRCFAIFPEARDYAERIHFYRGIFALMEALFGIENGDQEAFRNGMKGIGISPIPQ